MWDRFVRLVPVFILSWMLAGVAQPAFAALPAPTQPILVVQSAASADPYQNFVPEFLTTEGLNGFQVAQLPELTAAFLANYDVVILPHLALSAAQAAMFQSYVNAGGTLVGFRPDPQLANTFGVASLGTTLSDAWLKIDTSTPYASSLDGTALKFHGAADMYSLNGASALATLYNNPSSPTASPAATIYTLGSGKAILFSFDLAQDVVLLRQGNPAWAGYPNNHDGFNTMRASQMFMDRPSGQFWNDQGDGALNDVPQADIQLRLFSNLIVVSNAARRPLPRFWYFPDRNRALLLMTGDQHGDSVDNSIAEINVIQSAGGKFTNFLWYPFGSISSSQVNTWLSAGHTIGVHFDDTAEVDSSSTGGSGATWSGMQSVVTSALSSFAATFPGAPAPTTTRNHFLIWLSRNAAGAPDQTAQAKLFQNAAIEMDTTYSAFPNRWGYMTGSGLPMKFLDTATGAVIPVYEQATQYEDDIQLSTSDYGTNWNLAIAQSHYQKSLSESLTKYNTVVTMLFHPDTWSLYSGYAQSVLQYAQSNSIPIYSSGAWLRFWKARTAATISKPSFASDTLTFAVAGSADGLTLLLPSAAGASKAISAVQVDGASQTLTVSAYQGVTYASVLLSAGSHNVSVTYAPAGRILGQIAPSSAADGTTIQVQGGTITQTVSVAADGTYAAGPLPSGAYTVTPSSSRFTFSPTSRSVTVGTTDVASVNFVAANLSGQTLFTTQTPALANASDGVNYELGTAFTSDVAGKIVAVRFWKAPGESGTHTGTIWSATGQFLASITFANETASGWQQQALAGPLAINANTAYVVSVNTGNTFYVATSGGLAAQVVNGDLRSVVGNNGVFGTPGSFPTSSFQSINYFRDVSFVATPASSLASIALNPSSVTGGSSSTATVSLTNPAPAGGAIVSLLTDKSAAKVPASVTVAAGATTATFTVTTAAVSGSTSVNISGSYNASTSATLTINPPAVASVSFNPASVTAGSSSTGTVTLSGPAPSGGAVVALSDNNSAANTPATVTVAAGATGATFTVTTGTVSSATTVTVTAAYGGAAKTAALTINPASSGDPISNLLKGVFRLLGF